MKVCLINHCLANGGTDTFVINVAKGLRKRGHDVTIIMAVDDDGTKHFREQEALDADIKVLRTCDLDGIGKILKHCRKLYRILKSEKYDVVHGNMDLFNGVNMTIAFLAKIPVRVCHSHNSMSQYEINTGRHTLVKVYRFVMRKLCWLFSNRRCGCSEFAMNYLFLNRWKNDKNSMIIYNGIDFTQFQNLTSDEKKTNEKKESLGIPSNKKIIAVVGRFAAQKNPTFIVEIVKELVKIRHDFKLVWVGTGEMQEQIQKMIRENLLEEYICMLGARRDINEILQCSDAYLMPSLFEGLSIALIEAQAAGLPCLISDTINEMADCGRCVVMSLKKSADEWAENLSNLLDGKYVLSLQEENLRYFDVNYMIGQLENIYQYFRI